MTDDLGNPTPRQPAWAPADPHVVVGRFCSRCSECNMNVLSVQQQCPRCGVVWTYQTRGWPYGQERFGGRWPFDLPAVDHGVEVPRNPPPVVSTPPLTTAPRTHPAVVLSTLRQLHAPVRPTDPEDQPDSCVTCGRGGWPCETRQLLDLLQTP